MHSLNEYFWIKVFKNVIIIIISGHEMYPWLYNDWTISHWVCRPTFIQHRSKDGQVVVNSCAVPSAATELMLTLLDADFHPLCHARHDFHIVTAEAELFGYQARDRAAQDGLSTQWSVLVSHRQRPAEEYMEVSSFWQHFIMKYFSACAYYMLTIVITVTLFLNEQFSLLTSMHITTLWLFISTYKAHINASFCMTIF